MVIYVIKIIPTFVFCIIMASVGTENHDFNGMRAI